MFTADELASHVDERPSGVTGVNSRIRLDEVLVIGNAHVSTPDSRNYTCRNRLAKPERATDGHHHLTGPEFVRTTPLKRGKMFCVDLYHGNVAPRICADDLALELALIV